VLEDLLTKLEQVWPYSLQANSSLLVLTVTLFPQGLSSYFPLMYIFIIVRVIKSRRTRWAGHVERMWEKRGVYRVLVGKPE